MLELDYLLASLTIFLVAFSIYDWYKKKRLIKDISKMGAKYYVRNIHKLDDYYISYFLLKPEWYEKIKPTRDTSIGFDINTAFISFAEVVLMNENKTIETSLYIPCYKLRNKLEQKDLELLEQIEKFSLSSENYAILKSDLNKKLKKNNYYKITEKALTKAFFFAII